MNSKSHTVFELIRDPVIIVSEGAVTYMNPAAAQVMKSGLGDRSFLSLLPEQLLNAKARGFVSTAVINGRSYCVSAKREDGELVIVLVPNEPSKHPAFLNEGIVNTAKNALFDMTMSLELLRDHLPDPDTDAERYLSVTSRACALLNRQLGNVGAALSMLRGGLDIFPRSTDMVRLCSQVCSTAAMLVGGEAPAISFSHRTEQLIACVDPVKIKRMLFNLISNSVKNTGTDGKIELELSLIGANVVISLSDTGRGIPPEVLRHIFGHYSEALELSELSAMDGGGLGLLIARAVAESHGGALVIESRPRRGTVVRAMLPVTQPELLPFKGCDAHEPDTFTIALTELADVLSSGVYGREKS